MNEESKEVIHLQASRPCEAPQLPALTRSYWPAGFLALAGLAALSCDLPLALRARDQAYPRFLYQLVQAAEPYGHGIGVGFILLTLYLLAPQRRRALVRIAAMSLGAGLASNLLKLFIHRSRPAHYDFSGGVLDTFKSWATLAWNSAGGQSCPSSHTATAMGVSLGLAWLFPRGRWLFLGLTVLVAAHRVMNSAHFLSDVCWGAALGWIVGVCCLRGIGNLSWFDEFEARAGTTPDSVSDGRVESRRAA